MNTPSIKLLVAMGLIANVATGSGHTYPSSNVIWSDQPATLSPPTGDAANPSYDIEPGGTWEKEGYPIGNGRIAAMVFASPKLERYALNESSLWSGGKNPGGGYNYGPDAGENDFGSYQPFGDLRVQCSFEGEAQDFSRALDITTGIASSTFTANGVEYKRAAFASTPNQVIAIQYTASKAGSISCTFHLTNQHKDTKISAKGAVITLSGKLANGESFEGKAFIIPTGGKVSASGSGVTVTNADSIVVYIAMATDYIMDARRNWKNPVAPAAVVNKHLATVRPLKYGAVLATHLQNFKGYFDRVVLDLGKTEPDLAKKPTKERLQAYKSAYEAKKDIIDPELEATIFNMGRYLIFSSTRKGNLPANLQGIWNDSVKQAWACDYHNNINFQMAYWAATTCNLLEAHQSMLDYVFAMIPTLTEATQNEKSFASTGGKTPRGWTARTSQNIWGGSGWQWNIPASAWYGLHIWEQYLFTQDRNFLKKAAYPVLKEITHFWEDHLKELGAKGEGFSSDAGVTHESIQGLPNKTLVAPHGWSPEQGPREDGVMHDQQLIRVLFEATIEAAKLSGEPNKAWVAQLVDKKNRLAPNMISPNGYLQEWLVDRPELVSGHRHTSHLFDVYPGSGINTDKTPELAAAALKSLELRGTTGDCRRSWVWPWRTALFARFGKGDTAHEMVGGLLAYNTLDNLLTTHPPMQMDGNFGIPAGMAEMLLQSHAGIIDLLPAPTKAWPNGKVAGLRARGNIIVSMTWQNGRVTHYTLTTPTPIKVRVRVNGEIKEVITKGPGLPTALSH